MGQEQAGEFFRSWFEFHLAAQVPFGIHLAKVLPKPLLRCRYSDLADVQHLLTNGGGGSVVVNTGDGTGTGVAGALEVTGPNTESEAIVTLETNLSCRRIRGVPLPGLNQTREC